LVHDLLHLLFLEAEAVDTGRAADCRLARGCRQAHRGRARLRDGTDRPPLAPHPTRPPARIRDAPRTNLLAVAPVVGMCRRSCVGGGRLGLGEARACSSAWMPTANQLGVPQRERTTPA